MDQILSAVFAFLAAGMVAAAVITFTACSAAARVSRVIGSSGGDDMTIRRQ